MVCQKTSMITFYRETQEIFFFRSSRGDCEVIVICGKLKPGRPGGSELGFRKRNLEVWKKYFCGVLIVLILDSLSLLSIPGMQPLGWYNLYTTSVSELENCKHMQELLDLEIVIFFLPSIELGSLFSARSSFFCRPTGSSVH